MWASISLSTSFQYRGVYDRAADIGCGSGQSTQLLATYFQRVYGKWPLDEICNETIIDIGYDISANQINEARQKSTKSNVEYRSVNVRWWIERYPLDLKCQQR
jgi:trans-aconitate methyltransferase